MCYKGFIKCLTVVTPCFWRLNRELKWSVTRSVTPNTSCSTPAMQLHELSKCVREFTLQTVQFSSVQFSSIQFKVTVLQLVRTWMSQKRSIHWHHTFFFFFSLAPSTVALVLFICFIFRRCSCRDMTMPVCFYWPLCLALLCFLYAFYCCGTSLCSCH